jgi:hypothetical protein
LLLTGTVLESEHWIASKYAECCAFAGTSVMNAPVTGALVVRLALTVEPGTRAGLASSHAAVVFAGRPCVDSVPAWLPPPPPDEFGRLMLMTFTPGAPTANPPCSLAFAERLIVRVYAVPLPVAEHVFPDGTCTTAAGADT